MNTLATYAAPPSRTLHDYLDILRQHRTPGLIVSLCALAVTLAAAVLWPPTYRSSATILIEQQEIPADLVRSTVTTYADQRIQIINQRVMTRSNLAEIIRKYDLYAKERRRDTLEEVIDGMRADIHLKMVSADVVDPRNGYPTQATIAFTLAYENGSPQLAQKVANELTTLFLNENLTNRREMASEASGFLTDEVDRASEQMSKLEEQLANFKERNPDNLPEMTQYNMQLAERIERDLSDTEQQLRSLKERSIYLQSQLAQINPRGALYSEGGDRVLGPVDRLKTLRARYAGMVGIYGPDHPDLVRMRKEIAALEADVGPGGSTAKEILDSLDAARAELAADGKRYGEDHPTVQRLQRQVAALEGALTQQQRAAKDKTGATDRDADNPAYIQIQAQLQSAEVETRSLLKKEAELKTRQQELDKHMAAAPAVEQEYRRLTRDYDNAWSRYKEFKSKQTAAKLGENLETERKAERFTLIDPPLLPQQPASPNRFAIAFLGLVLSAGSGLGTVVLRENLDGTVRGARGVAGLIDLMPLAGIPYIETGEDRRRRKQRWRIAAAVAGVVVVAAVLIEHFFFVPLDVLWFAVLRHF